MRESLYRAARTFAQTAIGYFVVNITVVEFASDKEVLKSSLIGLAISAISAGVSAIMNVKKEEN